MSHLRSEDSPDFTPAGNWRIVSVCGVKDGEDEENVTKKVESGINMVERGRVQAHSPSRGT